MWLITKKKALNVKLTAFGVVFKCLITIRAPKL